ncbi:hypothetical protein RB213_001781, partial [Colletotrichum asianum]
MNHGRTSLALATISSTLRELEPAQVSVLLDYLNTGRSFSWTCIGNSLGYAEKICIPMGVRMGYRHLMCPCYQCTRRY